MSQDMEVLTMTDTSYAGIPGMIERRSPFKGNSLKGVTHTPGHSVSSGRGSPRFSDLATDGDYIVYSYATPVAYAVGDQLFVTSERFSMTTTRGQNLILSCGNAREIDPDSVRTLAEVKAGLGLGS